MVDEVNPPRRRYDNRSRQTHATARRHAILRAGHELLVANGYSATTMATIAEAAGVSVETVYKGFGNKPELVRQILGTAVAGDDEPTALIDRPSMQAALRARSGAQILAAFAEVSTDILTRIGPLLATLLIAGRAGEPELRDIARTVNEQRLADIRRIVDAVAATGDLHPALDPARAADILWTIGSPEVHQQLTVDRGWSNDDYGSWLTTTLRVLLLH
jgi:AcrR family transcriptional regulator